MSWTRKNNKTNDQKHKRKNFRIFSYKNSFFDHRPSHGQEPIIFRLLLICILFRISQPFTNNLQSTPITILDDSINRSSSDDYDYVDDDVEPSSNAAQKINNPIGHDLNSQPNNYANQYQTDPITKTDETNPQSTNEVEKNPSEIQKAVCTITAGEVKASAEAVTTKTLKGVCSSAELKLALGQLEEKIFGELETLKRLLLEKVISKEKQPLNCISASAPTNAPIFKQIITPTKHIIPSIKSMENSSHVSIMPKLKSLQGNHKELIQSRDKEVTKFNNTMLADKDIKIFTYYWRLENFTARIESGQSITIDSPRFAIKGKPLHLKAFFQHLHRDFLYVQLNYAIQSSKGNTVNPKSSTSSNIMLDMGLLGGGSLFKAISTNDQILFKYKISILDQQNLWPSKEDLTSQEFHNLEGGFLIPNSALLKSPYIKDDTILIQLFLYL